MEEGLVKRTAGENWQRTEVDVVTLTSMHELDLTKFLVAVNLPYSYLTNYHLQHREGFRIFFGVYDGIGESNGLPMVTIIPLGTTKDRPFPFPVDNGRVITPESALEREIHLLYEVPNYGNGVLILKKYDEGASVGQGAN